MQVPSALKVICSDPLLGTTVLGNRKPIKRYIYIQIYVINLYRLILTLYPIQNEGNPRQAADAIRTAPRLLIRNKK